MIYLTLLLPFMTINYPSPLLSPELLGKRRWRKMNTQKTPTQEEEKRREWTSLRDRLDFFVIGCSICFYLYSFTFFPLSLSLLLSRHRRSSCAARVPMGYKNHCSLVISATSEALYFFFSFLLFSHLLSASSPSSSSSFFFLSILAFVFKCISRFVHRTS